MAARHDKEGGPASRTSGASSGETDTVGKPAGHVVFDSRGNSVWQWNDEQDESTSILLKRLENDELELEPTRKVPVAGAKGGRALSPSPSPSPSPSKNGRTEGGTSGRRDQAAPDDGPRGNAPGGGFDPYNNS